ncbi:MAG TPA: hypothetical protein VLW83_11150, partial [Candidatus Acidoferrales bacterium]|nr:hypothetical protein [Candidatus Acidoferrales bacterium]
MAVTVTLVLVGSIEGALYCPLELIVPVIALPPDTPLTVQVTAVFVAPVTFAWKFTVAPSTGDTLVGEIVTATFFCPPPPP